MVNQRPVKRSPHVEQRRGITRCAITVFKMLSPAMYEKSRRKEGLGKCSRTSCLPHPGTLATVQTGSNKRGVRGADSQPRVPFTTLNFRANIRPPRICCKTTTVGYYEQRPENKDPRAARERRRQVAVIKGRVLGIVNIVVPVALTNHLLQGIKIHQSHHTAQSSPGKTQSRQA